MRYSTMHGASPKAIVPDHIREYSVLTWHSVERNGYRNATKHIVSVLKM